MKSWFRKSAHRDSTDLPLYQRRDVFLRETDRAMFETLREVLGEAYHVFVKVKLSDLVEPQVEAGNRVHQLHLIKVHRQTVDFLVCRREDMQPQAAVRLMPRSAYAMRGLAAQDVIDSVLRDIGLPCVTFTEKKSFDPEDLRKRLRVAMAENEPQQLAASGGEPQDSYRSASN